MEKVSQGVNRFALRLHYILAQDNENENVCLSPYSLFAALSVVYLGARGHTAQQMADALGLNAKSPSKIHEICAWLWFMLTENGSRKSELYVANQLFLHADIDIRMDFDQYANGYYNTMPVSMDFTRPAGCRRRINQWVNRETDANIQEAIKQGAIKDGITILSLSVAFFKGLWRGEFPQNSTYRGEFFPTPDSSIRVDMMYKEEHLYFGDFKDLRAYVVFLPICWTQGWMTLLLPYQNETLAMIEYRLASHGIGMLWKRVKKHLVSIHLPKFRVDSSLELSTALAILGMRNLIEPGQIDISAMVEAPGFDMSLSKVIHKACIEVNSGGTGTPKPKTNGSCLPKTLQKVDLCLNRPFLFFVQDGITKTIVVSGHVLKPTPPLEDDDDIGDVAL